jgi:hypothetical protein
VTYGGDSGNRIFVLYWRCPLIRVSVIRGSIVVVIVMPVVIVQRHSDNRANHERKLIKSKTTLFSLLTKHF